MNRLVLASVDNLGLELRSMTAYRDPDTQPYNLFTQLKRMEVNLKPVVKISHLLTRIGHNTKSVTILQERSSGWRLSQSQQNCQPRHLFSWGSVSLNKPIKFRMLTWKWDTQTGSNNPVGHFTQLLSTDVFLHFSCQLKVFKNSCSMEQLVSTFPKHESKLLIIACHNLWRISFL